MKRRISIHGLVLSVGMGAGCGAVTPSMTPSTTDVTGEQLTVTIEEDLARLRQLQIVEVRQLKLSLPAEATACYGLPCPGTEWQAQYDAERARQAPRLDKLATIAEAATRDLYLPQHTAAEAEAAAKALADLQVVEIGALLAVKPANNPSCYNLPCQSDIDAAESDNTRRVTVAFAIAEAAKKAGL